MASIQKTKFGYRAQLFVNGKRKSKCFRTQREAKAWADATTFAINRDAEKPVIEKWTFFDVLDKYCKEVSSGKRGGRWETVRIEAFKDHLFDNGLLLGDMTPKRMADWRNARLKEVSAGTVLRELGLLSAIFDSCVREWRILDENPIKKIKKPSKPEHRDSLYTWQQIRAILRACKHSPRGKVRYVSQSVGTCFLLALRTGMRAGELTGLTWDRVYADHVFLPVTKTKKRNVPLSAKARRVLDRMKDYDHGSVFGLTQQTLDANFRKYRKLAGIEGMTFHDSRHYAATQMAKRVDVLTLCKVFGWTNPKMAMLYYNPTASDIARMLDSL